MKALIVDEPYVSYILAAKKTWDMRSSHTTFRGTIALIRKGSGTIVGLVDVEDSVGPIDEATIRASGERHRIPANLLDDPKVAKWKFAWVLK